MNFCIFKSAVFDKSLALKKKNALASSRKKLLVSDLTFTTLDFGQILLIYVGKVKGFSAKNGRFIYEKFVCFDQYR